MANVWKCGETAEVSRLSQLVRHRDCRPSIRSVVASIRTNRTPCKSLRSSNTGNSTLIALEINCKTGETGNGNDNKPAHNANPTGTVA